MVAYSAKNIILQIIDLLAGFKNFFLKLFNLRSYVSFSINQSLLSDKVIRNIFVALLADFNIIAKNLIKSKLHIFYSAFSFLLFNNTCKPILTVLLYFPNFVQFRVGSLFYEFSVPQHCRSFIIYRFINQLI